MIQFQNENLTIFQSQLFKTTSTVIQTTDCILVVDPTWLPSEVEEIRQYVYEIKGHKPIYFLFTHSDWDHIIGYGAFPEATIIASKAFSEVENKEAILEQIMEFDDQYYIDRPYPITYPNVDIVVRDDGQVLEVGNTKMTFYLANGHTNDGVFAIIEPLGIWVAGDYLSDVEFPYIYDNSEAYRETLVKANFILNLHGVCYLIPGHGNWTDSREQIQQRIDDSLHYIKELRNAIQSGHDSNYLIKNYKYSRGMKACHAENIELITREMTDKK